MGEIDSIMAYSELQFGEETIDNMDPRLRDELQSEIQSYMQSITTKIKDYDTKAAEVIPVETMEDKLNKFNSKNKVKLSEPNPSRALFLKHAIYLMVSYLMEEVPVDKEHYFLRSDAVI